MPFAFTVRVLIFSLRYVDIVVAMDDSNQYWLNRNYSFTIPTKYIKCHGLYQVAG